jgi:hypothetical protein
MRAFLPFLFLLPAIVSNSPAEARTCHIVVAADRASTPEIFRHELAHCNGWEHPDQHHKGRPKAGYRAPKPPAKYVRPYVGKLDDQWVTTTEALKVCGSYGCQWFD